MRHLDEVVTAAGGIALRYGGFYGADNDGLVEPVRKRQFPIVGDGGGYLSFIHLDDAAAATVLALEHDGPAIYNVVDDEPAPVREWLPAMAAALGAGPPRHVPVWLARLIAGELGRADGHRGPRRFECEGEARARVDAALPELAAGLRRGVRAGPPARCGRGCGARDEPRSNRPLNGRWTAGGPLRGRRPRRQATSTASDVMAVARIGTALIRSVASRLHRLSGQVQAAITHSERR